MYSTSLVPEVMGKLYKKATPYRRVVGRMLYIGRISVPLVLLYVFLAVNKLPSLRAGHLRSHSSVVTRLKTQGAKLLVLSPTIDTEHNRRTLDIISDGTMTNVTED